VDKFDFIIIGAGSAGCVLADKLTTTGRHNVLVLEAGPSDNRFWINTPIGYGITYTDSSINWNYFCEPEKTLGGRSMYWPRGKVLGGSSSINALVYHRGQAMDYDDWAAAGNPGWDYQTIRSAYDDLEDFSPPADNNRWPGSDNPGKSKKLRLSNPAYPIVKHRPWREKALVPTSLPRARVNGARRQPRSCTPPQSGHTLRFSPTRPLRKSLSTTTVPRPWSADTKAVNAGFWPGARS